MKCIFLMLCLFFLCIYSFAGPLVLADEPLPEIINLDRTYLAIGDRITPIKLEFSFKYRFFSGGKLFFGYHQKSFWDINNKSAPVLDTNFNPHILYELGTFKNINWNLGIFEHLSNGGTFDRSRGTNMSYIHALKKLSYSAMKIDVAAKAFVSYKLDNDSPDINEYMGMWSAVLRFKEFLPTENYHSVEYRFNFGGKYGTKPALGSNEIGLYYQPIQKALFNIYTQFFFGRNEYLLDYKIYKRSARIGIAFVY